MPPGNAHLSSSPPLNSPATADPRRPGAVFLSYASQDAEAARRICEALRTAGVEVWFDQNELVGGDAWDAKIRRQIAECALFVPIISANTQARLEGYFRIEWKIAAQRTHAMAEEKVFLLPVVIDGTRDAEARVPAEFRAVQWTRLSAGQAPSRFCERVRRLLDGHLAGDPSQTGPTSARTIARPRRHPARMALLVAGLFLLGGGLLFLLKRQIPPTADTFSSAPAAAPAPPALATAKSVAVLPFVNLSGDKEQEYFSDGVTEEVLNALARESDLRVPGRTSSFSFKGKNASAVEIAAALNVGRLVEGSVQRAGGKVRIRVSLTRIPENASEEIGTFTEDWADTFALQDKVARAVVEKLTGRTHTPTPEVVSTKVPEAYDLYLKANSVFFRGDIGGFEEAIRLSAAALALDPGYARAAFTLAAAHSNIVSRIRSSAGPAELAAHAAEARRWATATARLDPRGLGASAMAIYLSGVEQQHTEALKQANLALEALPNSIAALTFRAWALVNLGRPQEASASFREAVRLDPLNPFSLRNDVWPAVLLRRAPEAEAAMARLEAGAQAPEYQAICRFALHGVLPSAPAEFSALERARWLWRARRFAELEQLAAENIPGTVAHSAVRFTWYQWQHDARLRQGRTDEAAAVARELLALAQELQSYPDLGPSPKAGWLARALARSGSGVEAVTAGQQYVDGAQPEQHVAERWRREIELAELFAYLRRPEDCLPLLAKLLRLPSGLTVPILRVDPAWDNVREHPSFHALLADARNSAPL